MRILELLPLARRHEKLNTIIDEDDPLLGCELQGVDPHQRSTRGEYDQCTNFNAKKECSYAFQLAIHLLICCFTIAHFIAYFNYVLFKSLLYIRHFDQALFAAPWLLLILACEFAYLFAIVMSAIDNCIPPSRRPHLDYLDIGNANKCPTVHILLPCCKEPTEVPVESIRAALAMDYPSDRFKVIVLDDGADDALRAECGALQADHSGTQLMYLRRTKLKGVPHHFKCGNLNYGLQHSDAEFVVMMDADMILHRSFLRRLLPYLLHDSQVAFVQIPQSFYNLPPGDPLNDACLLGYDRVLPNRDSLGCASCVGTGAIFRRQHLDAIGGFQPQSITEDTMTAYALFNKGYRSVYLRDKLQIGLTPWTFEGYVKQRARWGQGAMQQFVSTWRSMLGPDSNLNFVQKALYIWHTGYYFLSIANVALMATLLMSLAFELRLTVGNEGENVDLIAKLAVALVLGRIAWTCLWWNVPLPILCKNRDDSHFWWMTPFFLQVCIKSVFDYASTFQFIPTSNVDRGAATGDSNQSSMFSKMISLCRPVAAHLIYSIAVAITVSVRTYSLVAAEERNCQDIFFLMGLSVFLVTSAAHMLIPVIYLFTAPNYQPSQRKSLLRYNSDGVPVFSPEEDCLPKWRWSVMVYEMLATLNVVFWLVVGVVAVQARARSDNTITRWCTGPRTAA